MEGLKAFRNVEKDSKKIKMDLKELDKAHSTQRNINVHILVCKVNCTMMKQGKEVNLENR